VVCVFKSNLETIKIKDELEACLIICGRCDLEKLRELNHLSNQNKAHKNESQLCNRFKSVAKTSLIYYHSLDIKLLINVM